MAQFGDSSAIRTFILSCFNHRNDLSCQFFRLIGIVLIFDPCSECFLIFGRSAFISDGSFHCILDTCTHLFVSQFHTQTEFTEVFEQRVSPCRTFALFVCRIRSRWNRTRIDRRTSRSVSNHFTITEQLGNQFYIRSFTTTGASAGELEQRSCKLRILHIRLDVYQTLLRAYVSHTVRPVVSFSQLTFQRSHRQRLVALESRTDIGTVTATQTVENINLHTELHTLHCSRSFHIQHREVCTLLFFVIQNERTDRSVRTNISTLVTLDTVCFIPNRNKCSYTTFFIFCSALMPCTVFDTLESRNLQQIAILCIDRTNYFVDECRIIVYNLFIIRQVSPCRINSQLVVFATTVNSCIVFVYNIFTLLAIRLHDEFLHLFDSQINRNYTCDTEKCRLQDCIGAVTQTNFQCDLCSIDIINRNIFLSEITFYAVRQVFCQFFAIPYRVQQECTVLTQTASHIVHTQVSLNVTSHKIRCVYQIGRADRMITETQVRTSETAGFLRVVREIGLTIFICIVTDDLD